MPISLDRIDGGVAQFGVLIFTCPAGHVTHIQNLNIMNPQASARTFKAAVLPAGEVLTSPDHYLYWDVTVDPGETINLVAPIILASGDQIVFEDSTNGLVFTLFGEVRN